MHILVVDDEPGVLRMAIRVLEAAGHTCRGGATIAEGQGLLREETFDVAVLDVHVGADSGLDLARAIRRDFPAMPFIMVTGAADFTSISDARVAGALDYLVKPVSTTALTDAVNKAGAVRQRRLKAAPGAARDGVAAAPMPPMPPMSPMPPMPPLAPLAFAAASVPAVAPPRPVSAAVTASPTAVAEVRAGEPPIDRLFREMVRRGASDLHLSSGSPPRIRVDGAMQVLPGEQSLSADDIGGLLRAIVPGKNLIEFDERHDSDFAYEVNGLGRFRGNIFLDRHGMGAVFRLVPTRIMTVEELELSPAIIELCQLKKGLILVTGPTGSGKSTTLAAMINYINRTRTEHIVTIEDPIEFVHENERCLINQREVHSHTKSFKAALRAALREDPDIVLIGEMRDLDTVAIALETAETGHLVFGTLHTTTAASTVDRIIDQFPAGSQAQIRVMLSESLRAVIAQTLCRRIGGGRIAAHEVLIVTTAISNLIRQGKTFQIPAMMQVGRESGMTTLDDALMDLVRRNRIAAEEARLHAHDKSLFGGPPRSAARE